MPESTFMLTPSEVIEHLYCPRFTYFMHCLNIEQHEELRHKVILGRNIHDEKTKINKEYVRKKIGCVGKDISVYLASHKKHIRGIADEVLYMDDGSLSPLDYKFSEYKDYLFNTHRIQSVLYAELVEEAYNKPVKRGYICYVRKGTVLKEIIYKPSDFEYTREVVSEMSEIINKGFYPKKTRSSRKCPDCCYKNICV